MKKTKGDCSFHQVFFVAVKNKDKPTACQVFDSKEVGAETEIKKRRKKRGEPQRNEARQRNHAKESATSARATGAGAASATSTTNRVAGSNAKPRTWASIHIIDTNCTTSSQETFLDEELQTTVVKNFIIIFWLIQSQAQRGACSATLHQGDTQGRINIILLQVFSKLLYCLVSNCKIRHINPPVIYG
ncbi:MAG: hypothetical protein PHZ02_03045 [Desulfocapsaceae bacterium]|nr:hypothetical protein [Desulfocapsaceae bacterium]